MYSHRSRMLVLTAFVLELYWTRPLKNMRGVTVNVVAPGFIATDMTAKLPAEQQQQLTNQVALGRLGSAEDIAHAVAFLASPQASYITGETLHVNGGMYMV